MAISKFEKFKVTKLAEKFCAARNYGLPREQLYIDFELKDQSLVMFEVRPHWNDPAQKTKTSVAKFTYVKKDKIWKLYWQRQNMKWQLYDGGTAQHLDELFDIVNEDLNGCFWS